MRARTVVLLASCWMCRRWAGSLARATRSAARYSASASRWKPDKDIVTTYLRDVSASASASACACDRTGFHDMAKWQKKGCCVWLKKGFFQPPIGIPQTKSQGLSQDHPLTLSPPRYHSLLTVSVVSLDNTVPTFSPVVFCCAGACAVKIWNFCWLHTYR